MTKNRIDKKFSELFNKVQRRWKYKASKAKLDFAVAITRAMKHKNVSRSELARRLETSPSYVTKLLRGDANVSIETMVKAANAVSSSLCIHVADDKATVRWLEEHHSNLNPGGHYRNWNVGIQRITSHPFKAGNDDNESALGA